VKLSLDRGSQHSSFYLRQEIYLQITKSAAFVGAAGIKWHCFKLLVSYDVYPQPQIMDSNKAYLAVMS